MFAKAAPEYLQPSGLNNTFPKEIRDFKAYIDYCKEMIATARIDKNREDFQKVIDANCPYELYPEHQNSRRGVLLIHGLYESPYHTRAIAEHFQQNDCLVRSILLPGHGTVPGDLLDIQYTEWLKAVKFGIESFQNEVDELYLYGYSTGAALALHHTLQTNAIKGLIFLVPALRITRLVYLAPLIMALEKISPRMKWIFSSEQEDKVKYSSFSLNSSWQVQRLIMANQALLKQTPLHTPLFLALSESDRVINTPYALQFFQQQQGEQNRLIYYGNKLSNIETRITLRANRYPEQNISALSHICLPFPASDPYYGVQGEYTQWLIKKSPQAKENITWGATSLDQCTSLRMPLTYNPDFEYLASKICSFINQN